MAVLTEVSIRPWYREPWPWLLMSGPAIVVVAGLITAWLAIRSNDGLVADDYYKQGLAVNQVLHRDQLALSQGVSAELLRSGPLLKVFLHGAEGFKLPRELSLKITHPSRAGEDQLVRLQAEGAGLYAGKMVQAVGGVRRLTLEDEAGAWRLLGEWRSDLSESLQLTPAGAAAKVLQTVVRGDK